MWLVRCMLAYNIVNDWYSSVNRKKSAWAQYSRHIINTHMHAVFGWMEKDGHDNDEDADAECFFLFGEKIHSFRKQFQCRCEQKCILFFTFSAHNTPHQAPLSPTEIYTEKKKHTTFPFSQEHTNNIENRKIDKRRNGILYTRMFFFFFFSLFCLYVNL